MIRSHHFVAGLSLGMLFVLGCNEQKPPAPKASEPAATASAEPTPSAAPAASSSAAPAASASAAPSSEAAPEAPPAPAADFDFDTSHSRIGFSVRHMMVSTVRGYFKKFSGKLHWDEANPSASTVELEIDVASIDTNEPKRDDHLRSPDFFDAKKFATITFKSTAVKRAGAGWEVTGDLKMRDVTKPVVLTVDAISPEVKDPWGGERRGTRISGKVNRQDFGVKWSKALDTGGAVVGDEVTLDLEIEVMKKKADEKKDADKKDEKKAK